MWPKIRELFKTYFFAGLLVLGPLVISAWVIKTIIDATDNLLRTQSWLPFPLPGLGIIVSLAVILLAGFLGRNVIGRSLFYYAGEIVVRIPVIGNIYSSIRQIFETLLSNRSEHFSRVVLIPYPYEGTKTLAFVTSETVPQAVQAVQGEPMLSIYIPTTPNPTSGFYLYVPISKTVPVKISVEDAFKTIVSLGLAAEDRRS